MIAADPEQVRQTADEILSRPEYRGADPTLLDRALSWVGEQLAKIFSASIGSGQGYWIGYAILAAAAMVVVYVVWRVFPRGRVGRGEARPAVERETTQWRSRDQWLARARQAEAEARWDEAVHARYHALTTGLADRSELPPEASTTSGEHIRAFTQAPQASPGRLDVFSRATERFERVWFGGAPAAGGDSQALAQADHELLTDRP